jgi:hypothetical protein
MLSYDHVFRVEFACLSKQRLGLFNLAQKPRFAGLLHQFRDAMLMRERYRLNVVGIFGIEPDRLGEHGFCSDEVAAVEQACAGNVGVLSLAYLPGTGMRFGFGSSGWGCLRGLRRLSAKVNE